MLGVGVKGGGWCKREKDTLVQCPSLSVIPVPAVLCPQGHRIMPQYVSTCDIASNGMGPPFIKGKPKNGKEGTKAPFEWDTQLQREMKG